MVNSDYRKEIGVKISRKTVPKPVGIIVLLAVAGAISFSVVQILQAGKARHESKQPAAAATTAAPTPAE